MRHETVDSFLDAWDRFERIEELGEEKYVALGKADDCDDCEWLGDADDIEFSWSTCDTCGSSLGGKRHPAHIVDRVSWDTYHLNVCLDCRDYMVDGQLPFLEG